jgi:hypothetical protein
MEQLNQKPNLYNLIVCKVDEHNLIPIIQYFTEIFALEKESAEQIIKSAPIIFLDGLDKEALKTLRGRLVFLSKMGVEFLIAASPAAKIPRVVWSGKSPKYTESSSGELIKSIDFQWNGNAFVCPNCSETFVFKRIGNPLTKVNKMADDKSKYIEVTEGEQSNNILQKDNEKADNVNENDGIEVQAEGNYDEVIEPPPFIEQPQNHEALNNAIKSTSPQEETLFVEDKTQENGEIPEPILEPIPESIEEPVPEPVLEPIEEPIPEPVFQPIEERIATPRQNTKPVQLEKPNCSVFLTSIPPDKKAKATELIAKLKGINIQQAQVLTTRLLVPVLKDVTKSVANKSLEEFKKIGVNGRITVKI